jgi:hypothetical protein
MAIASTFGKNSMATHYGTIATHGAIYTTAPGASAGTEPSGGSPAYARKPLTWSSASGGVITASATFDVPAGTTVVGTGLHDALTAGNYIDGKTETSVAFPTQDTVTVNFTFTEV